MGLGVQVSELALTLNPTCARSMQCRMHERSSTQLRMYTHARAHDAHAEAMAYKDLLPAWSALGIKVGAEVIRADTHDTMQCHVIPRCGMVC